MANIPDLATCKKIGFIVPSSNTAVEPTTTALFQSLNTNVICVFTRIRVKTVGTDAESASQFSTEVFVEAARLLADAQVDAILWNGTSGMWTEGGLEADKQLAKAMKDATSIPCSTTSIAIIEALNHLNIDMISIAVPYDQPTTARVKKFFKSANFEVYRCGRLEQTPTSNIDIAKSCTEDIKAVIRCAKSPWTQAVVVACTNWPASSFAEDLETELEVTIIDSVTATVWCALRMIGVKKRISGWGLLMYE